MFEQEAAWKLGARHVKLGPGSHPVLEMLCLTFPATGLLDYEAFVSPEAWQLTGN